MEKIKIITDSCSDLNKNLLEKYDIDYAKMSTVYDGKEKPADLTWQDSEVHELYEIMRQGNRLTTAQVSSQEFHDIFVKYLELGYDIIYIGCSTKQSGSVNTGNVIAKKLLETYVDSKIVCIDSLNASLGEGMLAIEASKLVKEGADFETVVNHVLEIRKKVNQYVTVHSLTFLHKAGRVKGSAAFFGNLMGIKPILISDINGEQVAYKKVKGRINSFKEIVDLLKESVIEPENQTVYIAHSDCSNEEIITLEKLVREQLGCKDVCICYIGPIIGASIGPDAVGIWAFGKDVTFAVGDSK